MRVLSAVFAILFFLCAAIQYNDPDPLQWMAIYGAAAVISTVVAIQGRIAWFWPAFVAGIALVWGLGLAPALGRIAPNELMATMKAGSPQIEESREALGLFLVAVWMIVVALAARRPA